MQAGFWVSKHYKFQFVKCWGVSSRGSFFSDWHGFCTCTAECSTSFYCTCTAVASMCMHLHTHKHKSPFNENYSQTAIMYIMTHSCNNLQQSEACTGLGPICDSRDRWVCPTIIIFLFIVQYSAKDIRIWYCPKEKRLRLVWMYKCWMW